MIFCTQTAHRVEKTKNGPKLAFGAHFQTPKWVPFGVRGGRKIFGAETHQILLKHTKISFSKTLRFRSYPNVLLLVQKKSPPFLKSSFQLRKSPNFRARKFHHRRFLNVKSPINRNGLGWDLAQS